METISTQIAVAQQCTAVLDWMEDEQPTYPPVVNHPDPTTAVHILAAKMLGDQQVVTDVAPSMGGEDFSFMGQVPRVGGKRGGRCIDLLFYLSIDRSIYLSIYLSICLS